MKGLALGRKRGIVLRTGIMKKRNSQDPKSVKETNLTTKIVFNWVSINADFMRASYMGFLVSLKS